MSKWLVLHQKVAAALIVFGITIVAGPWLASMGIDLSGAKQAALVILTAYMAPAGGTQ